MQLSVFNTVDHATSTSEISTNNLVTSVQLHRRLEMDFVNDIKPSEWRTVFSCYNDIIAKKAEQKLKPGANKELLQLDKWYQSTLPDLIQMRNPKFISHEELVKVMKWKLSRGKFRPQLLKLAESNSLSQVEKLSLEGFKAVSAKSGDPLESIKTGITHLTGLRGVGPATASAILTAGCPDKVAFMADEAAYIILCTTSLKYSLSEYMLFVEEVRNAADKLQRQDPQFNWTPHKVELTLWTYYLGLHMNVDFDFKNSEKSGSGVACQATCVNNELESPSYSTAKNQRKRKREN